MSWEPDCSLQMTVTTTSLRTFFLLPRILCLCQANAHVCTMKMAEDGLIAYFAISFVCPSQLLCLYMTYMGEWLEFYPQDFGPCVQNSDFTTTELHTL
jgi:hypothetical protein